eukprot:SAG31_NODE_3384_length_4334_cov_5.140496_5_plen_114_part_00
MTFGSSAQRPGVVQLLLSAVILWGAMRGLSCIRMFFRVFSRARVCFCNAALDLHASSLTLLLQHCSPPAFANDISTCQPLYSYYNDRATFIAMCVNQEGSNPVGVKGLATAIR